MGMQEKSHNGWNNDLWWKEVANLNQNSRKEHK
jgi:hypothetical protein